MTKTYDVIFDDGHVERVDVGYTGDLNPATFAELGAVGQYPGYARVVNVREVVPTVELYVPRYILERIKTKLDGLERSGNHDSLMFMGGMEDVLDQLGITLPEVVDG